MSGGTFKVKADDTRVIAALTRARQVLGNLREPLADAAQELTRRVRYRFTFKRDPDNAPWAPWAPRTRASYRGQKRTLMLNTRRLRDGTRFIAGRNDLRAVIGTPYGYAHEQPDGTKTDRSLPRRAFLFSYRNGGRALAKTDESYLLNELRFAVDQALGE